MTHPAELLQTAIPAALEAGRAILQVYARPAEEWEVEQKSDHSPLTLADRASHAVITRMLSATGLPVLSEEGAAVPAAERRAWKRLWIVDPLDGTKEFIKRNGEFTVNVALVDDGQPVAGVIVVPAASGLYFGASGLGAYRLSLAASDEAALDVDQLLRRAQRLPEVPALGTAGGEESDYVVVASRSHPSPATEAYIAALCARHPRLRCIAAGSSLKLCRVAEGAAQAYPRFAPTMEWDTAAGDAIVRAAGGSVLQADTRQPLRYNKPDLHNPHFLALAPGAAD